MTVVFCLLACAACLYWRVGDLGQQKRVDRAYRLGTEHGKWIARSPGSSPGGVGAAPEGPLVTGTGVGFPQAHPSDGTVTS